jgi:hypothetical protein
MGPVARVDARANRGRTLDVAEEVFGKGGESASTEEVARLAGVGIATVFRHFPTKAALLQAVLVCRGSIACASRPKRCSIPRIPAPHSSTSFATSSPMRQRRSP